MAVIPFRLNEFRTKIQFITSAQMPSMIRRACLATGAPSNTVYIQHAVAEALSRDLGIPVEEITARLPEPRGPAARLFGEDGRSRRAGNVVEEVR